MKTETMYLIYDERYWADEDSAMVLEVCDTLKEAKSSGPDYGGHVIVKTVFQNGTAISSEIC